MVLSCCPGPENAARELESIPDRAKGTRERPKIGPKELAESHKRNQIKPRREQGSPKPFNLLSKGQHPCMPQNLVRRNEPEALKVVVVTAGKCTEFYTPPIRLQ